MGPIVYAIVRSVSPKASATPAKPIPVFGKPAANTALPQPPKTSQNVPKHSAASRRDRGILDPPLEGERHARGFRRRAFATPFEVPAIGRAHGCSACPAAIRGHGDGCAPLDGSAPRRL